MCGKELVEGVMKIIPCTEATFLISKRQESALAVRERLDLLVHLFLCKFCRRFLEHTRLMLSVTKEIPSNDKLTAGEKQKMTDALGLR